MAAAKGGGEEMLLVLLVLFFGGIGCRLVGPRCGNVGAAIRSAVGPPKMSASGVDSRPSVPTDAPPATPPPLLPLPRMGWWALLLRWPFRRFHPLQQ